MYHCTVIYWYNPNKEVFYLKFDDNVIIRLEPTYYSKDLVRTIHSYFLDYDVYSSYYSKVEKYVDKIYNQYQLGCR